MNYVEITERGDAGLDFSWVNKLFNANIIITKSINDKLIENVINNKEKIILHSTITGYGNTKLEPNVPSVEYNYNEIKKLIQLGFPKEQIVLRVDPIIPNESGIIIAENVFNKFKDIGIKRVRFSFLDMYPHVKERFKKENIPLPYETFIAPHYMIKNFMSIINKFNDIYEFEACAECIPNKIGCISQKDIDILKLDIKLCSRLNQRSQCLCPINKIELLNNRKQCKHGCLYCYWK